MTNPTLVTTPFANSGDKNSIPESVGSEPQNATMQSGFPPVTQQKISEGGIPPERNDFNGILNLYGQHVVHLNKGLPYYFDATFATSIGGYPVDARISLENGDIVRNTVANNINNPNSNMTGWYQESDKFISVLDFGIVGGGSDERSKFTLAVNKARSKGVALDLAGLTINTGVAAFDIDAKVQNGKLKGRYQFNSKVDLENVDFEINSTTGFYIRGTSSNIIQSPKLKNVKITYDSSVVPDDAFSIYADYCESLQIVGGEFETLQLIHCPNYRIINATFDGKMRNNNELIHASVQSKGGIVAFNTFKNSLDNVIDLYSSGAETLFVNNQIIDCGNRLGTVMEIKVSYSDDPNNSSNSTTGFARSITIANNIFKNCKATHAVNSSIINIYTIDAKAVPTMTSVDYISDIIVQGNIIDGYDTSAISTNIRLQCIFIQNANNVKVINNIVKNIGKTNLTDPSCAILMHNTNNCVVTGNTGCIDQSSGIAIQGVNNNLTLEQNNFNKDVNTNYIAKYAMYLNRFTGTVDTAVNDSTISGTFEGSLNSVFGNLATFNSCVVGGHYINNFDIGSINDCIFDNVVAKLTNGTVNAIKLGSTGISTGNTLNCVTVVGTGTGTGLYLSNLQDTTLTNIKTKNLALSVNFFGANAMNIDVESPKQKDVTTMFSFDASVTAANKATINLYGLTATKSVDSAIVIASKAESLVYITGAAGFSLGMPLATAYSAYANGVTFNSIVTSANTIEVHIINNTASSVTVPVGLIKVRAV